MNTTTCSEYLSRIQRGHQRIENLVTQISTADREVGGACGEWSARQLLAHLEAWNVEILDNLRRVKAGARDIPEHDVDEFNRRAVEARRDWTWDEVLERLFESQRWLREHLEECATEGRELAAAEREWVEVLASHDEHHISQLADWVESRANEGRHGA